MIAGLLDLGSLINLFTCTPSSPQLCAESLGLNVGRQAAILSNTFLCRNSIGVRLLNAECGLRQL